VPPADAIRRSRVDLEPGILAVVDKERAAEGRNSRLRRPGILVVFLEAVASNDSVVVDVGNFQRFRWLFLGKL